ncbi:pyruvate kinase [Candidatus Neomarinimicrobiota bacterium]
MYRKTRIVATIGPASIGQETIRDLLRAGVDVFRINTSHTTRDEIVALIQLLRRSTEEEDVVPGILLDLAGPKIRVSELSDKGLELMEGDEFTLGTGSIPDIKIRPDVTFEAVANDAKVMLDDGRIELKVVAHEPPSVLRLRVVYGGHLTTNKGVNFPGVTLGVPSLTERDEDNLRVGLKEGVDWVALSFVRSPEDRKAIDRIFKEEERSVPVMAKVEKPEAINKLNEIVQTFDGIMVARGDLGVEMPLEEVPLIQKQIIGVCNVAGKPVITATQLLESMVTAPSPTRAEVNDVANAIYDGTDAVMLSSETAIGKYPVKSVEMLNAVATATEEAARGTGVRRRADFQIQGIGASISHAACSIAAERDIPVIVTMTHTGSTARNISRFRPKSRIVALSPFISTCRQLQLSWGVTSLHVGEYATTDEMITTAEQLLLKKKFVQPGDYFILTAGVPIGQPGTTNLLKVQKVR